MPATEVSAPALVTEIHGSCEMGALLLQHPLQRRRIHIPSRWNFIDNGNQIGETFAAFVGQDARDGDFVHLGVEVVEFDEAACGVFMGDLS